ncbi:MAG: ABC transporter permease [Lachnospiraceae bacterium]|nr:ABC transporter permease [Lachnospiraceae bacterium]
MSNLGLIFKHYFKREATSLVNIGVLLALPMAFIALNLMGNIGMFDLIGEQVGADLTNTFEFTATTTAITILFMVSFQFFAGELILRAINEDLRGEVRWRLFATPNQGKSFLIGAAASSWVFNLIQGILIFGLSALVFDVYWGNMLVVIPLFLLVSISSQLIASLIAILAPKRAAFGIHTGMCFLMMFLSGWLFVDFGDGPVARFIMYYVTPLGLGARGILYAGPVGDDMRQALFHLGILAAMTVILAFLVLILGRRQKA